LLNAEGIVSVALVQPSLSVQQTLVSDTANLAILNPHTPQEVLLVYQAVSTTKGQEHATPYSVFYHNFSLNGV
jgi:hypothetical protein